MLQSHVRFHSVNGKRQILVVDDEFINRELLRAVLKDQYELLFAEDGQQGLDAVYANKDNLSLILLDLMMPVMGGMEMLRQVKADPSVAKIPVIVISADEDAEVESLTVGATDFIPKPYPQPGVILARIRRTIELSEDREIINSTERDTLTGLYNREYFYRYAEQYDQHHKDAAMDAIVVDVNHFHMINERFGTAYGDSVLRRVGEALRSSVLETEGIVCRREADTFMVYCRHGADYEALLENASMMLTGDDESEDESSRIWLRMGVYAYADKTLDIERRFDRAKMAADTVQGSFTRRIGVYDNVLHERELYTEQLVDDFEQAVREHQFQVYYQPKFDVRPDIPVLASAEALVRWVHPSLGFISPGVFIPLFEENGLIQRLDTYVWRETAAKIADWKARFGFTVPVSVNVSRIDMYDPHLVDTLQRIISENGLGTDELLLEITESAYTQDSDQIINTVNHLRELGFKVEMDDFGTGYSSLNMVSSLPIDALKLDMQFIRNAFSERKEIRIIEVIIDIADYLGVPVIAEGVETEEQMLALKAMGCDYVQGYYFSRPVPAEEYERFVIERRDLQLPPMSIRPREVAEEPEESPRPAIGDIAHALSSGFEAIYYVNTATDHYVVFGPDAAQDDLQIEDSGNDFFAMLERRVSARVHEDDAARVRLSLQKEALLAQLTGAEPFVITYRVMGSDAPVFYSLKAVRALTHDDHHIVVGISDVDLQVRQTEMSSAIGELDFASLVQALSGSLEQLYYVDVTSGAYQEFRLDVVQGGLELCTSGKDFFGDALRELERQVYADDRQRVAQALDRDRLLESFGRAPVFSLVYRMVRQGEPQYYRLRAALGNRQGGRHLIVGVTNIDAQVREGEALDPQWQDAFTYASIVQALATDYFSIYYVDTETNAFVEYGMQGRCDALGISGGGGGDFFEQCRLHAASVVHPDDLDELLSALTKERILVELSHEQTFTHTYRILIDGTATYLHMKVTRMEDRSDQHIVIGISNVDEQMRREEERARALRMANQDALTGVKSKHAYTAEERKIDQAIAEGTQEPFAVVVCDVNGLKQVNDTKGHVVGDQYLKDACMLVCNIFKHSPVFRVGGDEFVALLRGADYEARDELMARLTRICTDNYAAGDVSVAAGIAIWDPEADDVLASVFGRADEAMYVEKRGFERRG